MNISLKKRSKMNSDASDNIKKAVEILQKEAPDSTVILFGSHARGKATNDSDLDFLVIEPKVKSTRKEMSRLRRALLPIPGSIDILVTSRSLFEKWSQVPGTIYYEAAREGQIYHART
jgi:predicted nucleotidyltransferase